MTVLLQAAIRAMAMAWLLCATSAAVHGHAVVVGTVPADGALVEAAPGYLAIRFNEPVTPVAAQVLNAAGEDITPADAASVAGDELRIALPAALAQGSYIASYRIISADSHPVGGSLVFSVGRVSERVSAPMGAADDGGWAVAMVMVRTLLYGGIMGGAGAVLFLLAVGLTGETARSASRIAATFSCVGSLAAFVAIGVQGGLLIGGPAGVLADAATWRLGLTSGLGTTAVTCCVGLALVAAGLAADRPVMRPLAYAGAAAALASLALSGHVVTAASRWITIPVLITHTIAAAFWIGSLLPLRRAVARSGIHAAPVVERFSRGAIAAVAALALAGLVIIALQVESPGGLVTTTYGLILLGKLVLVAGLLGLAVINKMRLTPRLAGGDAGAGTALRHTIAAEMALAAGILVATAALGTTPPPRVLQDGAETHAGHIYGKPAPRGLSVTIIGGGRSAEIRLDSGASGSNGARIRLMDSAGRPLQAQEVTFIAANPSAGVEPIRRTAEATGPGTWTVDQLLLVPAGSWSIRVDALISDFEKARLETVITLR